MEKYKEIIHSENYWKLILPKKDHKKGIDVYESEYPDYITNMTNAFKYMHSQVNENCTLDLYMKLASLAMSNETIQFSKTCRARSIYPDNGFSDEYLLYLIENAKSSNPSILLRYPKTKGESVESISLTQDNKIILEELKESIKLYSLKDTIMDWGKENRLDLSYYQLNWKYSYGTQKEKTSMRNYRYMHEPEINWISVGYLTKCKITNAFADYERDMLAELSQKDKLLRIIKLIHYLNGIVHGFLDGNLRINGHIMFHKELIRHKFDPIILDTYMIFETMSPDEINSICKKILNI